MPPSLTAGSGILTSKVRFPGRTIFETGLPSFSKESVFGHKTTFWTRVFSFLDLSYVCLSFTWVSPLLLSLLSSCTDVPLGICDTSFRLSQFPSLYLPRSRPRTFPSLHGELSTKDIRNGARSVGSLRVASYSTFPTVVAEVARDS